MWETILIGNWKTKEKGAEINNYLFGKFISPGDMG